MAASRQRAVPPPTWRKSHLSRAALIAAGLFSVAALVVAGWYGLARNTTHDRLTVLASAQGPSAPPPVTAPTTVPPTIPGPSAPVAPAPPPPSSPQATPVCQARLAQYAGPGNPMHVSLVAAYGSTAADVAADDEGRHATGYRSPFTDRPPGEYEAVCWFEVDPLGPQADPTRGAAVQTAFRDREEDIVRPDGVPVGYRKSSSSALNPEPVAQGTGR
jgi:hypothetical protein